jgi:hypothetical protein
MFYNSVIIPHNYKNWVSAVVALIPHYRQVVVRRGPIRRPVYCILRPPNHKALIDPAEKTLRVFSVYDSYAHYLSFA